MIFQAPETLTSARTGNNYRALSEGNYYLFILALSEGNYYLFTLAKLRDMEFELMPIII